VSGIASITREEVMPSRLGRYDVRAKIGVGGMATVYLGRPNTADGARYGRAVALKVIKEEFCQNPEFVTMFVDEAKIISRLSHPNLVQVVELGSEGDRVFIAMELLMGQSLWAVWNACRARSVRLRYDLVAWVGARVAEGLHHAHEMRDPTGQLLMLVHRDVNQSNIFLTYDGQVKVIDFGLATAKGRAYKTASGVVKGKIAYLAPEQVAGHPVDRRADVFALGTTLWELTTDRRLFRGKDDSETLQRIYAADVPDPTTLVQGYPPALREILRRALARETSARYATVADFGRSLDFFAVSEGRTVNARALADVMSELFADERVRDQQWLAEASAADRPAPQSTMHPAPILTLPPPPDADVAPGDSPPSSGWPRGAPPDGMFSPAPSRPADGVGPKPHEPREPRMGGAPLANDGRGAAAQTPGDPAGRPPAPSSEMGNARRILWGALALAVVLTAVAAALAFAR
jgi:eukaryotic-like serine/threonine-protein kinase